jgi:hypothetical protein
MTEIVVGHSPDGDQVVVLEREHPLVGYEAWIEHGPHRLLLHHVDPNLIAALRASLANLPTPRLEAAA